MTHLNSSRLVKCPYVRAVVYIDRYVDQLPLAGPQSGRRLRLRAPLDALGIGGGLALDRDVVAEFDNLEPKHAFEHAKSVTWRPEGGGPFPVFKGSLLVAAATPKSCVVSLEGDYEPPLGVVGKAFDATAGRAIAQATADELLRIICERLDLDHMRDEPHLMR